MFWLGLSKYAFAPSMYGTVSTGTGAAGGPAGGAAGGRAVTVLVLVRMRGLWCGLGRTCDVTCRVAVLDGGIADEVCGGLDATGAAVGVSWLRAMRNAPTPTPATTSIATATSGHTQRFLAWTGSKRAMPSS